jgi:hypothetical protein
MAGRLIKECTDNPAFKEMLESMRSIFGFEGCSDMARQQGREGSARLSLVRLASLCEVKAVGSQEVEVEEWWWWQWWWWQWWWWQWWKGWRDRQVLTLREPAELKPGG